MRFFDIRIRRRGRRLCFIEKRISAASDFEGENDMITRNPYRRQIPDYYDTMFEDGFEPWEILAAAHKKILAAAKTPAPQPTDDYNINIKSEVKVKK